MYYKHSNSEVTETDEQTGRQTRWKVCDICGRRQHSNYGFTVSYAMPDNEGASRHGYCNRCARQLVPALTEALREIEMRERSLRAATR